MQPSLLLSALAPLVLASPSTAPFPHPSAKILYTAERTFFENIAFRSNGHLLLNALTSPSIYTLDPHPPFLTPQLLTQIPDANGLTGIAEPFPDLFVVNAAVWNLSNLTAAPNTTAVWAVDLRSPGEVGLRKVVAPKGDVKLNGMEEKGVVLIADSLGAVWSVDVLSGETEVVTRDELLKPEAQGAPLGVNGLHVRDGWLYFSSSGKRTFARVRIDSQGRKVGNVQVVARLEAENGALLDRVYDDFAFDRRGNAWITAHDNLLAVVTPEGKQRVLFEGNQTLFDEPTNAVFGRGSEEEERTLYVTTGGTSGVYHGQIAAVKI
ncbi:MAG: hypothetical protein MMC23_006807 [Stictis urceolatum]|nr:hypothetical protein [Stictis urceolata]